MKSSYDVLGNYIRLIDVRNSENVSDKVLGISIDKYFMPSVANIIGTDLSKYKLISKGYFACNPMHVGRDERLPVALYKDDEPALVSPAYFMFEIIDRNILNEEYLMMWFRRSEFDRNCWLKTDGSVRGGITWEDFCRIEVFVPPIEEQKKIVNNYQIITKRIELKKKINDNLETTAITIYKHFISNLKENAVLSNIAHITMGTSPEGNTISDNCNGTIFYQGKTDFGFKYPTIRLFTTNPKRFAENGDILMSVRAPVGDINISLGKCAIGRGLVALKPKNNFYSYLYYTMKNLYVKLSKFNGEGTVFGSITKDELFNLPVIDLPISQKQEFELKVSKIDECILKNELEIQSLIKMKSLLISNLSR